MRTKSTRNVTIRFDGKKRKYRAKPATIRLKLAKHGEVVFTAIDTDVIYFFPVKKIFKRRVHVLSVPRNVSKSLVLGRTKGKFPYAVFCRAKNAFAEGNSPPTMIID